MAKWLVTGASGLLGHHVCEHLLESGVQVIGLHCNHPVELSGVDARTLDLMDFENLASMIAVEKPDFIFHTAAMTNVDACEKSPELARAYNTDLPVAIAKAARQAGGKLIHVTTDQLWPGHDSNVSEIEAVSPVNVYGQTKADSETQVLAENPDAVILRTNFFGKGRPWRQSFSDWLLAELSAGRRIKGFDDIYYTPISLGYFVPYALRLAQDGATGIFHLAGSERISKYGFIEKFATAFGLDLGLVERCSSGDGKLVARRPGDMSLSVAKVEDYLKCHMPDVDASISSLNEHHM